MVLNGYVLHVDLSPVQELVPLQRRGSNNLNQAAIQANTYGGIYPEGIKALQRDYVKLWGPLSELLEKLSAIMRLWPARELLCRSPAHNLLSKNNAETPMYHFIISIESLISCGQVSNLSQSFASLLASKL